MSDLTSYVLDAEWPISSCLSLTLRMVQIFEHSDFWYRQSNDKGHLTISTMAVFPRIPRIVSLAPFSLLLNYASLWTYELMDICLEYRTLGKSGSFRMLRLFA
jgi:hypothetical protein